MDSLEPLGSNDLCSFCARCGMVSCLPLLCCAGFYGLELFRGTFERLHKISKAK